MSWKKKQKRFNSYVIFDDYAVLFIEKEGVTYLAYVDLDDFYRLKKWGYRWCLNKGYAFCRVWIPEERRYKSLQLQRFIISDVPTVGIHIDHRDHNKLDCRKHNLRVSTVSENGFNREGAQVNNESSGIRGVSFNKRENKWVAYFTYNKKRKHVGYFFTKEEAERAVVEARSKVVI